MKTKEYHFEKLTPINDADISVYEEAIDFIFKNYDVKNVAITGSYSAGKSSVLESYKKKHTGYHFVHLSLAHFRTPEQEGSGQEESIKESVLEGKILNQLIHQIPAEKIPQTNFRVKKGVSILHLISLTVLTSFLIGSIAFLCFSSSISAFVLDLPTGWIKNLLSTLFDPYTTVFSMLICIVCSITMIFLLIRAQKNRNIFRKISLQGNEIEIFEDQDDSYFDKYLNEVLYLFENVEADVIVFEDMDRFNASRIFERLREVNTLVNIQRKTAKGEKYAPLRFFYLLRDDIFISKDRTKFFDFIIPIVPVVDNSNSYEQFLKHLNAGKLIDKFDLSFLQSLSLYVDDMRILKNIYNELVVYIHRLNTTDLDWNKMLAIITYKNLFPRDFSDLQLARGFVYKLFEQKTKIAETAKESDKERWQELNSRIDQAKKETLVSQQELDIIKAEKTKGLRTDYWGNLTQEAQVLKQQYDTEFARRKQAIQDNLDNKLPILESQLAAIEHSISITDAKPLKELITRENIECVFSFNLTDKTDNATKFQEVKEFEGVKGSDYFNLLKFLIRNGYIDETYTDYMTYFYEDSITANDKAFLRRITDRRGAEYTYSLKEPMKVIESPVLKIIDFEQEETLNFDLLECLLLNDYSTYNLYLKTFIGQVRETRNFDFLSKFYSTDKAREQFVIKINEQWPDFFSLALQESTLPAVQIRKYSIDTLYTSNNETLAAVNVDNCLAKYISRCPDYLNIEHPNIEKLIRAFLHINIRFVAIDYERSNEELFHAVYEHSLYMISFANISLMLKKEYGVENESDITHKNYTLVRSQTDSPLAKYISENISAYVEVVLSNCNGIISDDEDIAISLLNNTNIEPDKKESYIDALSTVIKDITSITEPGLWPILLDRGVVAFSEDNFINYFQAHSIDEVLITYLNNTTSEIDFKSTSDNVGDEIASQLFNAVVICNGILTEKYKKILNDLGFYFDCYDANEIADDKFNILISERILQMNEVSLKFVREKYPGHLYSFIRNNLDEYLAQQTAEIFRLDEALQILEWNIDDHRKIELLTFTDAPISIVSAEYSDAVNAHILRKNFEKQDINHLYAHYMQYGEQTQTIIVSLAEKGIQAIASNSLILDDELLSALLSSNVVIRDYKILLFTNAISVLNEDTCKKHFDELGLPELKGIFAKGGGRRNYEKSDEVTEILDALKANGWIYDYCDDERNSDRYIVIKNKPKNKDSNVSE